MARSTPNDFASRRPVDLSLLAHWLSTDAGQVAKTPRKWSYRQSIGAAAGASALLWLGLIAVARMALQ